MEHFLGRSGADPLAEVLGPVGVHLPVPPSGQPVPSLACL